MSKSKVVLGLLSWTVATTLAMTTASVRAQEGVMQTQIDTGSVARQIREINLKLLVRSKEEIKDYTPERVNRLTQEIVGNLTSYLLRELNQPVAPPPNVLQDRLRTIQGDIGLWNGTTNTPFVATGMAGSTQVFWMAYAINRGGLAAPDSKAILQIYQKQKGHFVLVDADGSEFDGHEYFVSPIRSRRRGEVWMLAHGIRFGDSQSTLKVVLYSFNGVRVQRLWVGPPFPQGQFRTYKDEVHIKYLDLQRLQQSRPPFYHENTYLFTEEGLKLVLETSGQSK